MDTIQKSAEANVLKVADDGVVYGFAVVCKAEGEPYFDLQGDHIPEEVMRAASTEFMLGVTREAKEMHLGVCKGQIVHSLPLTTDLAKALGIDDLNQTGWVIGMKPDSEEMIEKFRSGALTGFSIGGLGEFSEVGE